MSGSDAIPYLRRAADVECESVELAKGLRKGVLLGGDQGTPNFDMRRFVLEPGARVPQHTNEVEHSLPS
jgi:quercetin dioxygenase-like cupin family protein